MISMPLMKRDLKENWKLLFGNILFFCAYTAMIIGIFEIIQGQEIQTVPQSFAYYLCMALGIEMGVLSELNAFLIDTVYGFLIFVIPMIYEIVVARRLMIKMIRNGMMVWILSTPNGRSKVGGTQAIFLIGSLFLQMVLTVITGLISVFFFVYQEVDLAGYLMMNLGAFLLHILIGGFCFLISCCVRGNKSYYRLTIGILSVFFLLHLIGNLGGFFEYLQYTTIFSLYQPRRILSGENRAYLFMTLMGLIGILCYWGGVKRFQKRNFT